MPAPPFPEPRTVSTNGIRMAYYEQGEGIPIVLCHGFPELAYSWRHQLPALARAGYRAIAPDQRGYGLTEGTSAVRDYDIRHLTDDLVGLLDALKIDRAIFCGHDWGGLVVWPMAQLNPDRVLGVVGVNVPFIPPAPVDPIELFRQAMGERMYIVHFQKPGEADAFFNAHCEKAFRMFLRRQRMTHDEFAKLPKEMKTFDMLANIAAFDPTTVTQGDLFMSEEELMVFVNAFKRTGFTGPINWYRNWTRNWEITRSLVPRVMKPALVVAGDRDLVLSPALMNGVEQYVPDIETHLVPECGHWTQQEQPEIFNRLLIDWLKRRFS